MLGGIAVRVYDCSWDSWWGKERNRWREGEREVEREREHLWEVPSKRNN